MAERILIVDDEQRSPIWWRSIWKVKILRCAPSTQPYRR